MVTTIRKTDEQTALTNEIQTLLKNLGAGKVDGVAYDTAWVARLAPIYPGYGFEESLEWLRRNQYDDGTWGAPVDHFHDRYISTLAAIVALKEVGKDWRDERRVKRGEDALWRLVGKLRMDDSDTVGFPMLSVSLSEEAETLGLDVPRPPLRYAGPYQKKVKALLKLPKSQWRGNSLTYSLEGLRTLIQPSDDLLEANYSVSISPAATAAYLMVQQDTPALAYLNDSMVIAGTGAVPALAPIDVFEIAWALSHLRTVGAIEPDDPAVLSLLDYVWSLWSQKVGISDSKYFKVPDLDDTAACFALLRWAGYPVSADVFGSYEMDEWFYCYPAETNPSPSVHVRLLAALRMCQEHPLHSRWVNKALNALRSFDENGSFWWDKWHASPYYVNSLAVNVLYDLDNILAHSRLKWILRTQNDDGGWGYFGQSTPEETAYCLEALTIWDCTVGGIDPSVLDEAAEYLAQHLADASYMSLWIGKGLYTPPNLVKAAILSALYNYVSHDLA